MKKIPIKRDSIRTIITAGIRQVWALCNNRLSILGIAAFAAAATLFVVYFFGSLIGVSVNRYLEAIILMFVPGLAIGGLVLIPLGIFLMHRRELRLGRSPGDYDVKVKDAQFKGSIFILAAVTVSLVFPLMGVSGYKFYHFTESTEFCGQMCHTVMEPQAVAHSRSAHARVRCVECHIGSGADFFVKSKISGLRQVWAVMADTYPRPIPPAITELRPARDTCEECHWPSKFFGTQYKRRIRFSANKFNTRREIEILVRTGGGNESTGEAEGIHMHMLASGSIEYKSRSDDLQDIPWVKYTRKNGEVSIYRREGDDRPLDTQQAVTRVVDCMDCHNRGAHHFLSPKAAMDKELEIRTIDPSLPFIKRQAIEVLTVRYDSSEAAHKGIAEGIFSFYEKEYPELSAGKKDAIASAVERVKAIYDEQFFPEMKENWQTYPENVGHQLSPGCFRCHDGLHTDEKGRTIGSDCTSCHWFINSSEEGMECLNLGKFQHPNSLSVHRRVLCSNCHGSGKYRPCEECHKNEEWKKLRGKGQFRLPEDKEADREMEEIDESTLKDASFRLDIAGDKTEWELTEPLRQIKARQGDAGTDAPEPAGAQTAPVTESVRP